MPEKPQTLATLIAALGNTFSRGGDYRLHTKVQDVRHAANALKQRIADLSKDSIPADFKAALAAVDALL